MSRKFFKTVTAITAVCCLFFWAAGGFRLYKQASTRNHVTIRLFERLDKTFMNQLKINDAVPDELKTIFREEVRINPDIDSVTISKNNEEIFSARKTDASGIRVYNENKNLLIDRKSKPYALDETDLHTHDSFSNSLRDRFKSYLFLPADVVSGSLDYYCRLCSCASETEKISGRSSFRSN